MIEFVLRFYIRIIYNGTIHILWASISGYGYTKSYLVPRAVLLVDAVVRREEGRVAVEDLAALCRLLFVERVRA